MEVEKNALKQYAVGEVSIGKFSERLKISVWDSLELLKQQNKDINVSLEDYLRAGDLD